MAGFKNITPQELENKLKAGEKVEVIDVREHDEVARGMIPGAKHIPMGDIPNKLNELDKNKEYIFVCHSSGRSGSVCQYLHDQGYNVVNMVGGMMSWTGETK